MVSVPGATMTWMAWGSGVAPTDARVNDAAAPDEALKASASVGTNEAVMTCAPAPRASVVREATPPEVAEEPMLPAMLSVNVTVPAATGLTVAVTVVEE